MKVFGIVLVAALLITVCSGVFIPKEDERQSEAKNGQVKSKDSFNAHVARPIGDKMPVKQPTKQAPIKTSPIKPHGPVKQPIPITHPRPIKVNSSMVPPGTGGIKPIRPIPIVATAKPSTPSDGTSTSQGCVKVRVMGALQCANQPIHLPGHIRTTPAPSTTTTKRNCIKVAVFGHLQCVGDPIILPGHKVTTPAPGNGKDCVKVRVAGRTQCAHEPIVLPTKKC